ncbi:pantoate--beta-alanine ligase [Longispora sp. K20-0274]|uniref:pantoate--beta-alanine ligase n=1 Tax=Longispora sp. K20-0274 TaxID=3088255 RepID=UPI00399B1ED4
MTAVIRTRGELASFLGPLSGETGVVMTMGALHSGHASLLRLARSRVDRLIATIFVNPLQFGPTEDLDRYPRTLDADLEICRAEGVDAVFTPTVDVIYPVTPSVRIDPGPTGAILDGASRPGHFAGMLTVVHKLLRLTSADVAYFGEKDYQQLTLIRQMVRDLDMGTEIVGVPTVREPDGLALSSRNRFLSPAERERALALSRALHACPAGTAEEILAAAGNELKGVDLDYLALTDPLLGPVVPGPARLLVAARVGTTRLIDNAPVEVH